MSAAIRARTKLQIDLEAAHLRVNGRPEPCLPLVALRKANIYLEPASSRNNDGSNRVLTNLHFSLDSDPKSLERWAVISKSSSFIRTRFLQTLRGQYSCLPPSARVWPYLSSNEFTSRGGHANRDPSSAIRYVGFANHANGAGSAGVQGAYLGARYESRREDTDWSLLDYLRGTANLNLSAEELRLSSDLENDPSFNLTLGKLHLNDLLLLPVSNLSNGQTRRARIAKALLKRPEVLLLDEPFAGLDPINSQMLSELLSDLASRSAPRIVLAFPPMEVPQWITHVLHLHSDGSVAGVGDKELVYRSDPDLAFIKEALPQPRRRNYSFQNPLKQKQFIEQSEATGGHVVGRHGPGRLSKFWDEDAKIKWVRERQPDFPFWDKADRPAIHNHQVDATPLAEMNGVQVSYGSKCVLGNWSQQVNGEQKPGLHWKVLRGERWGIFGPNGSGKTTLISLLTSDHPQAYSLPLKLFERSRLPSQGQPGMSIFDIQSRIGHSSPEVHTYFPKHLTVRQTIENAWADAFHSKPRLTSDADQAVDAALRWFRPELDASSSFEGDVLDPFAKDLPRLETLNQKIQTLLQPKSRDAKDSPGKRNRPPATAIKFLEWLEEDQTWADGVKFSELSLSGQRVALFIRAVIKKPDIVVLDEAFSGMDERTRRKCMLFLAHGDQKILRGIGYSSSVSGVPGKLDTPQQANGLSQISGLEERQALICVSHRREELPFLVDKWLRLPEANEGKPVAFGTIDRERDWWADIWDTEATRT